MNLGYFTLFFKINIFVCFQGKYFTFDIACNYTSSILFKLDLSSFFLKTDLVFYNFHTLVKKKKKKRENNNNNNNNEV